MDEKQHPAHDIRIGSIRAAIWENETEHGKRFSATFEKLYKAEDKWSQTQSFGRDDLLVLAKVADQVHTWISEQAKDETPDVE